MIKNATVVMALVSIYGSFSLLFCADRQRPFSSASYVQVLENFNKAADSGDVQKALALHMLKKLCLNSSYCVSQDMLNFLYTHGLLDQFFHVHVDVKRLVDGKK